MHHDLSPRTPPGWEADEGRLLRFADPSGAAIAWFAPEFGGNCIGYAVRRAGGWAQIIHVAGPQVLRESPTRFGIPILFPFPGHVRGSRYTPGQGPSVDSRPTTRMGAATSTASRSSTPGGSSATVPTVSSPNSRP